MKLSDVLEVIGLLEEAATLLPRGGESAAVEELRSALGTATAAAHFCAAELKLAPSAASSGKAAVADQVTA